MTDLSMCDITKAVIVNDNRIVFYLHNKFTTKKVDKLYKVVCTRKKFGYKQKTKIISREKYDREKDKYNSDKDLIRSLCSCWVESHFSKNWPFELLKLRAYKKILNIGE